MTKPAIGMDLGDFLLVFSKFISFLQFLLKHYLGTTYSAVAVYQNGKAEVIPNDQGNRSMPSCVTFTPSRQFIGEGAVRQAAEHPKNAIYGRYTFYQTKKISTKSQLAFQESNV